VKLADQFRRYGSGIDGMPPLEVTEGADGELMINDGVTRATRVFRYGPPGARVPVVVIEIRSRMRLTSLPRVAER
jgi:hypothetical protein